MSTVTPLHDKVVVRLEEAETVSRGGIVLPGTAADKPNKGTVVAVGPGKYIKDQFVPSVLAEGDVVIFAKGAGTEIKVENESLVVINESEIFAKVTV